MYVCGFKKWKACNDKCVYYKTCTRKDRFKKKCVTQTMRGM